MKYFFTLTLLVATFSSFGQNLFINELIADNEAGQMDDFFQREDWVEIFNSGGLTNIGGYYISDDPALLTKWQIPTTDPGTTTILPNNHLILWIDKDPEQGADHVDFSLSIDGESVILTAPDGVTIIDQIDFPPMAPDVSYGRSCDGCPDWQYFNNVTYDAPNSEPPATTQLMFINEVQVNNTSTWKDLSNEYEPWLEIFNPNASQVNIAGYTLVLNGTETYTFPLDEPFRTVILPGQFKLIWADGEPLEGSNHTSFMLTPTGTIELKGPDNQTSDTYTYSSTTENQSYGRQTDGAPTSIVFNIPTPEVTNSLVIIPSPTLYINEVLAVNVADALDNANQYEDWFEVYNPNSFNVNIGGYYFSDNPENPRKWQVPSFYPDSVTIDAGGWILFYADEDMGQGVMHSSFKLNNASESLRFTSPDGITLVDEISWTNLDADTSYGRLFDGNPTWVLFTGTTPDASNNSGIVEVLEVQSVSSFSVYPNPTSGLLKLNDNFDIEIHSISGALVAKYSNINSLDVSNLEVGIYFLRNQFGDVFKVMKY